MAEARNIAAAILGTWVAAADAQLVCGFGAVRNVAPISVDESIDEGDP